MPDPNGKYLIEQHTLVSAPSLMTEFYRQLQRTKDKAQALRQAMLTTKTKFSEPRDWAALILIGEP